MGWAIGYDEHWKRDVGYGVPAECDHPECKAAIDRGLAHVCGGEPFGGQDGCGLYFCGAHLLFGGGPPRCGACIGHKEPFNAKPDAPEWTAFKLTDASWAQ